MSTSQKIKYADLSKTGSNLKNFAARTESIKNIISIRVGEMPFNRSMGCLTEDYLFETFSFATSRFILADLISSILRWDPYVDILPTSDVTPDYDNRVYRVYLLVQIKGLPDPFAIEEVLTPKDKKG